MLLQKVDLSAGELRLGLIVDSNLPAQRPLQAGARKVNSNQLSVERQFRQGRLPPCFASEKITELEVANRHIDALRGHLNAHEIHRELCQTPQRAWNQARKENQSVLRPAQRCPWWDEV